MKRLLKIGVALVLAMSLFSCADETKGAQQTQASDIVEELRIGVVGGIEPLTMYTESGIFGKMNYNAFCAGTFLVKDENDKIAPNLMTEWEIADDGKSFIGTFATDQGIMWHDGKPLTMDDIEFTVNYSKAVSGSSYLAEVSHVERISETQLNFIFEESKAFYTLYTASIFQKIYPKHIWENVEVPSKYTGDDAVIGCGPYKLTFVDKEAQSLHFEAVSDEFLGQKVTVKNIVLKAFETHDSLAMGIKTGEIDAMYNYASPISSATAQSLSTEENIDIGMSENLGTYMIMYGFKKEPTNDFAFRQAVNSALDFEILTATIGGQDSIIPGAGIIPDLSIGYDSSLPLNAQDIEKSKSILDDAGYKDIDGDGFREMPNGSDMNVVLTPTHSSAKMPILLRIAEVVESNLEDIGINVTLDEESVRNSDFNSNIRREGTYELFIAATTHGVGMFKTAYMYIIDEGPGVYWGSVTEPELLDAYQDLMKASNYNDYEITVMALQNLNAENIYATALSWDKSYFPYRTDKYTGWKDYGGWGVINPETWYNLRPIH